MKTNNSQQTGIWIDGTKAIIISLKAGKEVVNEIESDIEDSVHHTHEGDKGSFMGSRHINNEKKISARKKQEVDRYVNSVIDAVKNTDELYVFGPAGLKTKLKNKIAEHAAMSAKLKAVETSKPMTLNQCIAKVKQFYKIKA
jgi:hypothetical protein